MTPRGLPVSERIAASSAVDPVSGCWLWSKYTEADGYGRIYVQKRQKQAHRASYEAAYGPIPAGVLVCHACDVPACVNPGHLFAGTPRQNMLDMASKGRSMKGKNNGTRKRLSRRDIEILLQKAAAGEPKKTIARTLGISTASVRYQIRKMGEQDAG